MGEQGTRQCSQSERGFKPTLVGIAIKPYLLFYICKRYALLFDVGFFSFAVGGWLLLRQNNQVPAVGTPQSSLSIMTSWIQDIYLQMTPSYGVHTINPPNNSALL